MKVNVADLRKGDWVELENGKTVIIHNLASSHSGRGSRSFLVNIKLIFESFLTFESFLIFESFSFY